MNRDRLKKMEKIFQEALDVPPAERGKFLDERFRDDPALRREVESLLAADGEAGSFLDRPAVRNGIRVPADHGHGLAVPERIGRYRLIRKIGEGGMSEVYLAIRADDEFQKRVAFKIIRHDLDQEDLLRRFRTERQILAGLDHPNIAKLLDGGTTEDGLPYFVMDYIEGLPIDQYCDQQRLSITERLEMFRAVCSAVQYAHQSLVVHRDIKAGNIMVTADGVPKLLDFGIAKLLKPDLVAHQVEHTATWLRPMTPRYASPEQVQGKLVGTPSDVYSLGVLLYELLTGHLPYQLEGKPPTDVARLIMEEEPERLSTAIDRVETVPGREGSGSVTITPASVSQTRGAPSQHLKRQLAGDLDNIVLMALRKEPQRRYPSAERFSEDIGRYLEGLPVLARMDTVGYRTAKFLRRNRVAVGVAAAFVFLLVAFAVTMALQRDQARRERDTAEQAVAFMKEIFEVADPYGATGEDITAREVLDRGAEKIEQELRDQPEVRATLSEAIGNVYTSLGLFDRARPLLERSLETRRETLDAGHALVAQSLNSLGMLLDLMGDYEAAEPLLREALDTRRRALGDADPAVAESLGSLGLLLKHKGDLASAEELYRDALQILRDTRGEHPATAARLNDLGVLLMERGDYDNAESLAREALELRRKLFGSGHATVGETLNNLGVILGTKGDYEGSERALREALAVRRRALGDEHPTVGHTVNNLGRLLHVTGDLAGADPLYREALAIERKRLGDDHPQVAIMVNNVAELLQEKGDLDAAESMAREAMAIRRKTLGDQHSDLGKSLVRLGSILVDTGEPAEAEPILREGLQVLEGSLPENHWRIWEARNLLGDCLAAFERFEEAERLLLEGYEGLLTTRGPDHRRSRAALARVIELYDAWGRPQAAAEYREQTRD